MSMVRRVVNSLFPNIPETMTLPEFIQFSGMNNTSGQVVNEETSKSIATAYRAFNVLSDDYAKIPLQTFISKSSGTINRLQPDAQMQNIAWLLEISPNRFMVPFVFKKTFIMGTLVHGAGFIWKPIRRIGARNEMFLLNPATTFPVFDFEGNLWYQTTFSNGDTEWIPSVEVFALIINSKDGITGRGIVTYARETFGRQLGAHQTMAKFYAQGLNPGGLLWVNGDLDKPARKLLRDGYQEQMSGTDNAYRLAIMDAKVTKFEQITMKMVDAQFLETIQATDVDIAKFFGMPLYKLNMGKEAYNSNEQQNLDYLQTTLDPYLVQTEEGARLKWLSEYEQSYTYFKFNRDVLLRTDAKTRTDVLSKRIQNAQLSPNEARQIEDLSGYEGGDLRFIPANMAVIGADGSVTAISKPDPNAPSDPNSNDDGGK
jgi:HK97 family phage portal protein